MNKYFKVKVALQKLEPRESATREQFIVSVEDAAFKEHVEAPTNSPKAAVLLEFMLSDAIKGFLSVQQRQEVVDKVASVECLRPIGPWKWVNVSNGINVIPFPPRESARFRRLPGDRPSATGA